MLKIVTVDARNINAEDTEFFSKERRKRLAEIKNEKARKLSAAAEIALIRAVRSFYPNEPLPVKYERTPAGKPYLTEHKEELRFNLSHSGDYAVCAVSDKEIGVDIQRIGKANFKLCERFFADDEAEYVGKDSARFFEIWAKKEAYVKATGTGFSMPIRSFSVLDGRIERAFKECDAPEDEYVLWVCEIPAE